MRLSQRLRWFINQTNTVVRIFRRNQYAKSILIDSNFRTWKSSYRKPASGTGGMEKRSGHVYRCATIVMTETLRNKGSCFRREWRVERNGWNHFNLVIQLTFRCLLVFFLLFSNLFHQLALTLTVQLGSVAVHTVLRISWIIYIIAEVIKSPVKGLTKKGN